MTTMTKMVLAALLAILVGFGASRFYQQRSLAGHKKKIHAEIAAIRSYEESFALRNGHYLLLPDSCIDGDEPWKKLGKHKPEKSTGCFRVIAEDSQNLSPSATTADAILIIGENQATGLRGEESSSDKQPHWTLPEK